VVLVPKPGVTPWPLDWDKPRSRRAQRSALSRWGADEFRSANAQIELVLRRALIDAGRIPQGRSSASTDRGQPGADPVLVDGHVEHGGFDRLDAPPIGEATTSSERIRRGPPPDIEGLTSSGTRVAIELTAYYMDMPMSGRGGSALGAAQGQQETIARRAQAIFEARNGMLPFCAEPEWAGNRADPTDKAAQDADTIDSTAEAGTANVVRHDLGLPQVPLS
jgi:hypothetical protein